MFIICINFFVFDFFEYYIVFFFLLRKVVEVVLNKEYNIGGVLFKVD